MPAKSKKSDCKSAVCLVNGGPFKDKHVLVIKADDYEEKFAEIVKVYGEGITMNSLVTEEQDQKYDEFIKKMKLGGTTGFIDKTNGITEMKNALKEVITDSDKFKISKSKKSEKTSKKSKDDDDDAPKKKKESKKKDSKKKKSDESDDESDDKSSKKKKKSDKSDDESDDKSSNKKKKSDESDDDKTEKDDSDDESSKKNKSDDED